MVPLWSVSIAEKIENTSLTPICCSISSSRRRATMSCNSRLFHACSRGDCNRPVNHPAAKAHWGKAAIAIGPSIIQRPRPIGASWVR